MAAAAVVVVVDSIAIATGTAIRITARDKTAGHATTIRHRRCSR
jgi:hypothetical protein